MESNQPLPEEVKPVLKSMEQVLKDAYTYHREVVKPDDKWATWEECVKDGTVNVCYQAMSEWANQFTTGLSARLDWQINESWKQSEELTRLRSEIAALEATIVDLDKKLIESRQEGERLRSEILGLNDTIDRLKHPF
jgi:hypothetical protein